MSNDNHIWQDKEIRFDIPSSLMNVRKGEYIVESLNRIEDTKGNSGDEGTIHITNLRIIWYQNQNPKINLSIGYDCIINIEIKIALSNNNNNQILNIRSRFNQSRFEFIFQTINSGSSKIFSTFQSVCRTYESTKMFRDLKLRGSIINDKNLILMESEKIINKYNNIYNLSSDSGNLGQFIFTNVRVVWFSNQFENFNISIPYIQVKNIKKKDSKYGQAMILETTLSSGGYILGFKSEQLDAIIQELQKLYKFYQQNPILGVKIQIDNTITDVKNMIIQRQEDDIEIVDTQMNEFNRMRYMTQNQDPKKNEEIVLSKEIGLAIEQLPQDVQLDQLWKIINQQQIQTTQ